MNATTRRISSAGDTSLPGLGWHAADVDDVRALGDDLVHAVHGSRFFPGQPRSVERVRRAVDDRHDERAARRELAVPSRSGPGSRTRVPIRELRQGFSSPTGPAAARAGTARRPGQLAARSDELMQQRRICGRAAAVPGAGPAPPGGARRRAAVPRPSPPGRGSPGACVPGCPGRPGLSPGSPCSRWCQAGPRARCRTRRGWAAIPSAHGAPPTRRPAVARYRSAPATTG